MRLQPGTRIGRYEILAIIGAGGMGEVYRARDEGLQRDVAIKVLPERLSADVDRLARFEREARLLAALNHSSIAHVHGLEEFDGRRALVMELVEGSTLEDILVRGAVPLAEALSIALQIADALASAHERGIVHRDLKPGNVKLRPDGSVKVLDFGLAKALNSGESVEDPTTSPTLTSPAALTMHGTILGTAAYMSPEQARGATVDKRADIWAFGCVVFEMLTGDRAFPGGAIADTIAHVLKSDPDWKRLPRETPSAIRRLLRRCLEKDVKQRLNDLGDARLEILDALVRRSDERSAAAENQERWSPGALRAVVGAAIIAAAVGAAAAWMLRPSPPASGELQFDIATPPTTDPASFALSHDGRAIAYTAATTSGRRRLWVRSLVTGETKELSGTDGALLPFWAPTGTAVGFFAVEDGKLKIVDLAGGAVRVVANAPLSWGAAWNRDDTIVFAPLTGSIFRVASSGGEPVVVTKFAPGHSNHLLPSFLPDGRHFIYYVSGSRDVRGVWVGGLDGAAGKRLVDADAIAGVAQGHVLFVRGSTLLAQAFNSDRLELSGAPFPIREAVTLQPLAGSPFAAVSVSDTGLLAYRTGAAALTRQFMWVDRAGRELQRVGDADAANPLSATLSPDGRYLAMHRTVGGNVDLWLLEIARGVRTRLTSDPANDIHPQWSPDGTSLLFTSNRTGGYQLMQLDVATRKEKVVLPFQAPATDWSKDGVVLIQRRDVTTTSDVWALRIGSGQQPFPVVQTPDFDERDAQFSPDAKWIAYASNESGRWEVYVQAFPGPGPKAAVSINGGAQPRWRADGKELFFIAPDDRLMAAPVSIAAGGAPQVGVPVPLFVTNIGGAIQGTTRQQYFVSHDGQRFLMNTILDHSATPPITLVVNWHASPNRR